MAQSPTGTTEDANRAVEAAGQAFAAWAETPFAQRADIRYKARRMIRAREQAQANLLTREQGKPVREAVLLGLRVPGETAKRHVL